MHPALLALTLMFAPPPPSPTPAVDSGPGQTPGIAVPPEPAPVGAPVGALWAGRPPVGPDVEERERWELTLDRERTVERTERASWRRSRLKGGLLLGLAPVAAPPAGLLLGLPLWVGIVEGDEDDDSDGLDLSSEQWVSGYLVTSAVVGTVVFFGMTIGGVWELGNAAESKRAMKRARRRRRRAQRKLQLAVSGGGVGIAF